MADYTPITTLTPGLAGTREDETDFTHSERHNRSEEHTLDLNERLVKFDAVARHVGAGVAVARNFIDDDGVAITLPATADVSDGDQVEITAPTAVTGLTVAANSGQTVAGGASDAIAVTPIKLIYEWDALNTNWNRVGVTPL